MMFYSVLIAFLLIVSISATVTNYGLDDWGTQDVSNFLLKETGVMVSSDHLQQLGITAGDDLIYFEVLTHEQLGISPISYGKMRKAVSKRLEQANSKPADFWEWRAANRKLVLLPI